MNKKKYFVAALVLNTVLLTFAVSFSHVLTSSPRPGITELTKRPLSGPGGKFGPITETVLAPTTEDTVRLLDLETARTLVQPPFESLRVSPDTVMTWFRDHGADISCFLWSGGAGFVTYDMAIVPVDTRCWQQTTAEELLGNAALAPRRPAPRKLLLLGQDRPDTYIFRTGDGTLGMLRLVAVGEHGRGGVKVRYKLINASKSVVASANHGLNQRG